MIELINIHKKYVNKNNEVEVLKGISLHVNKNDIYGIIGYSGAGKSTLVRCINLLERPTSGEVIIEGKNLIDMSQKQLRKERKKIGNIFQHFNLLKNKSVFENIALPLINEKVKKEDIKIKVEELLKLVSLSDKKDLYPDQLSGGQKQRVAIARALATNPDILLCDEATSALDPETTKSILKLLKQLNKKLGLTIIIITHEMQVIRDICNKVAVIDSGRIIEQGSVLEIFSQPKSTISKQFVDSFFETDRIHKLLDNGSIDDLLNKKGVVTRMIFTGKEAYAPLISSLSKKFDVDASVILGNIEIIQSEPIGNLYVGFIGEHSKVGKAIKYAERNNVKVEVIRGLEYLNEEEAS